MKKPFAILVLFLFLTNFSYGSSQQKKPESYAQLVSWYKELEQKYPGYIEIFKANELYGLGKVDGGYDLYYVRITNESLPFHKPEVLFLGSPHGDETVGTIGLYWFAKWLMDELSHGNEWIKWLIDNREIYIEVSHNPYGFDNRQRWDANEWDLNREADYDWRGYNSELWGSVNGKTLWQFIEHHAIRVGVDFHGGARMILYPWSSTHENIEAKSPFSEKKYAYAPPDFYFYHTACLRLGEYMGKYGGKLDESNVGTIPTTIGYEAPGCISAWAYGANIRANPAEDRYVNDEIYGNYNGCGIFWISPEMSVIKDPPEWQFGDENSGYISEVIKLAIHQTDLAQPYLRWVEPANNSFVYGNVDLKWQVYGCLVAEETYIIYSFSGNPLEDGIKGEVHDEYSGKYRGGTYWDGKIWEESIEIPEEATDIYAIAVAKVDGIYGNCIASQEYGENSYLRIIKERTNESYHEVLNTSDGIEVIEGHIWWRSPILHLKVGGIVEPREGYLYAMGKEIAEIGKTIIIGKMNVRVIGDYEKVDFYIDNELKFEDSLPPFEWQINNTIGKHEIKVKMYHRGGEEEDKVKAFLFILN
ncbi:hypothetical protein B6U81_01590 [Thermoplasmatales archaeon ex4484_30]|nr:MAG: hypothetical protein B6U81_01590 [Thermoplasmatales archaeon ex4484_30]